MRISDLSSDVCSSDLFGNRDRESDMLYQKVAYYRGLEFYNERAFENSISLFMRSEKFPIDPRIAALATYWKAEAMYEARKERKSVVEGKSVSVGVDLGGRRIITKKKKFQNKEM